MAYTEIFFAEFKEMPKPSLGLTAAQFRVSFLKKDYSGEASEVELFANSPLVQSRVDSASDIYTPIDAQKIVLKLRLHSVELLDQFVVSDDRQMQVVVRCDPSGGTSYTEVKFYGWLLATNLSGDYQKPPYLLELTATDGISSLKDYPLLAKDGSRLQGYVSLVEVWRSALYWTGFDLPLVTGFNLYELADMATGQLIGGKANPARDPLNRTVVLAERYISDRGVPMSCYEVLQKDMGSMGVSIHQHGGRWYIMRIQEIAGGWDTWNGLSNETTHVRAYSNDDYSSGPDNSSDTSINLNVYTDPSGELQVLKKGSPKVSRTTIKPGIRVEQQFGSYRNKLPNPNFETVDSTNMPTGYERVNGLTQDTAFRVGSGTEEDPYRLRIIGISGPYMPTAPHARIIINYQSVFQAPVEYTKNLKRTLKARFWNVNTKGAQVLVTVKRSTGATGEQYVVKNGGTWEKATKSTDYEAILTNHYYTLDSVEYSTPGMAEISLSMDGIDKILEIYIALYAGSALVRGGNLFTGPPTPYIDYAGVRMEVAIDGLSLDGQQRTIARNKKTVNDTTLTLTLGDVPDTANPYDRNGTLYNKGLSDSPVATSKWYWPDANILATNPSGHNKGLSLIDWRTQEIASQQMVSAPGFNGKLAGRLPYGLRTILRVSDEGTPHAYRLTQYEYDYKACEVTVTGERIMPSLSLSAFTKKYEWQTPNGPIPQSTDDAGNPQGPATSQYQSLNDKIKQIAAGQNGVIFPKISALVPNHVPIDINTILPKLSVLGPGNQVLGTVGPLHRKVFDLSTLFV